MHSANPNCIKVNLVNLLLLVLFHLDTRNRLQSLDMRCRGSSAVFSQEGVGYSWLLNESSRHMLMLVCLREFIPLESWNSLHRSVWSLHIVLSLILLHRIDDFQVICIWIWLVATLVVAFLHYVLQTVSRGLFMYASINDKPIQRIIREPPLLVLFLLSPSWKEPFNNSEYYFSSKSSLRSLVALAECSFTLFYSVVP